MRLLFEIDLKDYAPAAQVSRRDSARAIIIQNGQIAMIHSRKTGFYKFPGGGITEGESRADALMRETREEAGLIVIPESIREYGYVSRAQKSDRCGIFVQDNFYYFCSVLEDVEAQNLDDYEAEEGFRLEYVDPQAAISKNLETASKVENLFDKVMAEREARVLEILINEGYFS